MGLVFQAEPSCRASGGAVTVSSAGLSASTSYSYTLTKVGDSDPTREGEFSKDSVPFTLTGLANGQYLLVAYDGNDPSIYGQRSFTISCGPPLSLDYLVSTAVTTTTGGTITVRASGGASPLFAILSPLNLRQQLTPNAQGLLETVFLNIPAGTYPGYVADSGSPTQIVKFTAEVAPYAAEPVYGCTDPAADNYDPNATQDNDSCTYTPVVRQPYFDVPKMQSLRYVQPTRTDLPAFDNTLLADETPLDYTVEGYCQKVEQRDTLVLQALSNYQGAPVLTIRRGSDDVVALTVPGVKVQQGAGQTASFEMYAKPDPIAGFTRLYFNDDALPLPFLPGQRVTITSTGTSLDGTYPLRDVLEDASAAVPYLRIATPYPSGNIRVDGTLTTAYVVQQYDTYQFVVPFTGIAEGCYYSQITATDNDFMDALAVSEPIDVAATHRGTHLISYRNFDNSDNLNYSHGLVNRQRVVSRFFDRRPTGEKTLLRNDNGELVTLKAATYGKVFFEALLLPSWLHEVLFVALTCDFVKVDALQVVLEGDYTYEPVERYTLGKGEATLERKNFLGAGNRDDTGDIEAGGGALLLANQKFIKANR